MVGNQFDQYCDTELCLTPGGRRTVRQNSRHSSAPSSRRMEEHAAKATHEQQQQQITIFYGSRVCVCDVTELQARAIICMAKQEMAESSDTTKKHVQVHRNHGQEEVVLSHSASLWTAPSTSVQPQAAGLSMTRSLQRFLHNRKTRAVDQYSSSNLCSHGLGQAPPPS